MVAPEIKDDVAVIEPAFNKVKKSFDSHKTRPYQFRLNQLKNFRDGLVKLESELAEAVRKDLGRE